MTLSDLLPPLLRSRADPTPEDEAAFAAFAADLTHQLGLLAGAIMLCATLLWWPLDGVLLPDARHVAAFAGLRWRAAIVEVTAIAVVLAVPPRAGRSTVVAVALYSALLGSFGLSLGTLRPADPTAADADWSHLAWFADAILGVVPMGFVPMPLRQRLPATLTAAGLLALGFFGAYPANLQGPGAGAQLSFLAFGTVFTVIVGEPWYQLTRGAFFERRALDRANADLAGLTATLSERVAERTATLRALARHLDTAQEAERRRIAHDLHDDLGQQLTAMRYAVARLGERPHGSDTGEVVEDLSALLEGTTRSMRAVISRLRPRVLDDLGLRAAVEWLCEDVEARADLPCRLQVGPAFDAHQGRVTPAQALVLFRAVQESTTNALKHAGATSLAVVLDTEDGHVVASVQDDGRGFDPGARTTGFGLVGLAERFGDLGGSFEVVTSPGRGTRVRAALPLA